MSTAGAPPPPPPPPIPGALPASRLPSEIPARVPVMNPPAALAGAMLKDKKPFTYTPGGLDLSEIKSPRMQRRLLRNAHCEGVRPSPLAQQPPQVPSSPSAAAPAACQGIAVQVLPIPGMGMGPQPPPQPKEPPKPKRNVCGPPPPPPPFVVGSESGFTLPAPAPSQPTMTSPPTIASPPASPPTQASQSASESGTSIPAAPPPPPPGSTARRCSLRTSSTTSTPPASAEPREPSPPPLPPPQAVRVPVTPPCTQEPPSSPPVREPVVVPPTPLGQQQEQPPQSVAEQQPSTARVYSESEINGEITSQPCHSPDTDGPPKGTGVPPAGGEDHVAEQHTPSNDISPKQHLPVQDQSPSKDVISKTAPKDPSATTQPLLDKDVPPVKESPPKEPSLASQKDTIESSPVKEPSPDKQVSMTEPSPPQQIPTKLTSPIRQSPLKEQSPIRNSSIKDPSPIRQSPLKEPSPVKQGSVRDTLPANQIKRPLPAKQTEPTPAKQTSIKEPSPVRQMSIKDPSPVRQTSIEEPLPVKQTPATGSQPSHPVQSKDPSPASNANVQLPNSSEPLHVSESLPTVQREPPQPLSPLTPRSVSANETAPWRKAAVKETTVQLPQPSDQPPQPAAQLAQPVIQSAPPGPTPGGAPEQVALPVIQTIAQEAAPGKVSTATPSVRHVPVRQASQPELPRVTQIPIQRPGAESQPPKQQQSTQFNQAPWQNTAPVKSEPVQTHSQPVTRQIPVRMASPPPSSTTTSPSVNAKGVKLVRQTSLPTNPSSPQISPPNAQLGSIYVPPTTSDEDSSASPLSPASDRSSRVSPTTGLHKGPLPWMCAQKQSSSPSFIVCHPQNAQQRHQNQQNRIIRQKSVGPESTPIQPISQATVVPQPEDYRQTELQRQRSLPAQQLHQQPQPSRIQQPYVPPQQTRVIPIQVQHPHRNQAIPVHMQQTQQQKQQHPRERIIPIMVEQDSSPDTITHNSQPINSQPISAPNETYVPVSIMRQQSEPTFRQQPQPVFQSQQSFQPQPTFQPQPSFQPQPGIQPQQQQSFQPPPAFQQPQDWQHSQQQQQRQEQPPLQQQWTNPAGAMFSPLQFPSTPLSGGSGGAFLPYNSPAGLYSDNNALDALHQMQQSLAQLNSGIQNSFPRFIQKKMSDSITPRTPLSSQQQNGADLGDPLPPVQSRSFRVLQNVLSTHQPTGNNSPSTDN